MARAKWVLLLLAAVSVGPGAVTGVKRLEWTDPQGRRPVTHQEWVKSRPAELDQTHLGTVSRTGFANLVDVVVSAELYPFVTAELSQYQSDLVAAGYSVQLDTMRGLGHVALRSHLAGLSQLVGAVLVGELPVAWYERAWGGGLDGEEFPIDIYFMDLNGTWGDANGNGLYDSHTGNTAPEIWVGRLYARPLTWDDEVRLVKRYFAKNHAYRTGSLSLPDRALTYIDDDWAGMNCYVGAVYADVTLVEDENTTRASDYRTRLDDGFEWIQVCSHSSAWGHTFRYGGGYGGTVFNTEIYAIRPHAHFYNLFACSGTRFVEENYSAGWDIFHDDYGLTAVGSSKTGSMLAFEDFYTPLGQGKCIGEAFREWYAANGEFDPDWFYGMNVMGDPTLKPHGNAGEGIRGLSRRGLSPGIPGHEPRFSEVVGPDPETDDSPRLLAAPGDKVWAIWKSGRSVPNGRFDIYASVRSGGSWSAPYSVGSAYYWETDPVLGLDRGDRPVAVWSLFTDDYYYNLYYSVWNGSSWSTAQPISDDCSSDLKACLCRDTSGTLWCFWYSRRDFHADVFCATFNGTSWSGATNLTHDSFPEYHPAAAATPNGDVWVAYTKYRSGASEIWARRWNGSGWTEFGPVSGTQRRAYRPAITAGVDGLPIACWQSFDSGNGNINYSRFNGSEWTTPEPVDADTALDVMPAMASDSMGVPVVVWMSTRSGDWDVYYSHYASGQWVEPVAVEPGGGLDINPAIAAGTGGDVWVAWQNLTSGNWDIHAKLVPLVGCAEQPASPVSRLSATPNPFRSGVTVRFTSPAPSPYSLSVYDAAGRLVRTFGVVSRQPSAPWSGTAEIAMAVQSSPVCTSCVHRPVNTSSSACRSSPDRNL